MTAIVTDANRGITDRFRSLPMAGSAVVAGAGSRTCSTRRSGSWC